jgi:cyclohexyl-isocyanide hydratase
MSHDAHQRDMAALKPLRFGLLLFPRLTALDLVGPQLLMATMMRTEVHLLSKTRAPVMTDSGFEIVPTTTYADCPSDLDVFFVPGGPKGTRDALMDDELLDFVAAQGARARYVTSVCTGSVILGAAGLLKGYKASSHWGTRDMLPIFGAEPVEARVVTDRNRITGGGITAGLDFGLVLAAELRGEATARLQELVLEYDPRPPFNSGTLRTARPETVQLARTVLATDLDSVRDAANQAKARRSV